MPLISIPSHTVDGSIHMWLHDLLSSSKNIDILAENSLGVLGKGDDDLRIREMTEEERKSEEKYETIHGAIIFRKKKLHRINELETMEPFPENNVLELSSKEDLLKEKKFRETQLEELEAIRAQSEPKWWSEWLALNRPESANTAESGVENSNAAAAAGETPSPPPPKNLDKVD